jgi:hypothetical protein
MKNVIFLLLSFFIFSCHKKDEAPDYAKQVQGTYKGTYQPGNGVVDSNVVVVITRVGNNQIQISSSIFSPITASVEIDPRYPSLYSSISLTGIMQNGVEIGDYALENGTSIISIFSGFSGTKQ